MAFATFLSGGGGGSDDSGGSSSNDSPSYADFRQAEATTLGTFDAEERNTQQEQSGGWLGGVRDAIGGAADFTAGSTDEAVARSADDEQGGGIASGVASFTGASAWSKSQDAADLRRRNREAGGGITGALKRFDNSARAGFDFVLDNPNASVQEGLQEVAKTPTEIATGRQVSDEELAGSAQDVASKFKQATQGTVAEGTVIDNPATSTAVDVGTFLGEAIVADPSKALFRGATGVSVDEGTTEGTVGAVDAFDIGVTVGTAGAGKAATSALKGVSKSDEAGTLASRLLGRTGDDANGGVSDVFNIGGQSDEAAGIGDDVSEIATTGDDAGGVSDDVLELTPAADEAGQASDDVIQLTEAGDETAGGFRRFVADSLDEGAGATDDTAALLDEPAGATDDVAQTADEFTGSSQSAVDEAIGAVDDTASGVDDVAQTADETTSSFRSTVDDLLGGSDDAAGASDDTARLADEGAGATDDAASGVDDAASLSDEAAQLSDEAAQVGGKGASAIDNILAKIPGGKWTVGGGLFLGGGILGAGLTDPQDAPKKISADGYDLVHAKDYEPIERFPQGGRLYAVSKDFKNVGYWLLLGIQGRNLLVLDENGEPRKAKISAEQFKKMMKNQAQQQGGSA